MYIIIRNCIEIVVTEWVGGDFRIPQVSSNSPTRPRNLCLLVAGTETGNADVRGFSVTVTLLLGVTPPSLICVPVVIPLDLYVCKTRI